ncbi:lipoyl(octanoyl) transferase LipB [Auritidibacter ignavus]|uniref:lipoyl(octanoyl) transferase LipB n=1 Tax=Auritidibacter TaxID=1160973 RepID=UPI000D73A1F3|nr:MULTISPECIES: lipoyl(octanoyl) transferase LipB [Auritidibacter]PXA75741.1 lipoate-protein ligase B [Auritidibacter sp. NML100628]WGH91131.1 lipoyl(octanoyl) transferase LipB [Auritidibacter ignavus]
MRILNELDNGLQSYATMDQRQREIHRAVSEGREESTLLIWQAESTYTAGRNTKAVDIISDEIPVIETDRAGSVTWHGPGQLIVYPIVKLAEPIDTLRYIRSVEASVLTVLGEHYDLPVERIQDRAGVWLRNPDRKISAIGLKISRGATMHGISLNVTTDPNTSFTGIIPCGINDAAVTSMAEEGVTDLAVADLVDPLVAELTERLTPLIDPVYAATAETQQSLQPHHS